MAVKKKIKIKETCPMCGVKVKEEGYCSDRCEQVDVDSYGGTSG